MSKSKKSKVVVDEVADPKAAAIKAKIAKGTTEPLPVATPAVTEVEKAIDDANVTMAAKQNAAIEEVRQRLEALKAELKAAKELEKAAKNADKDAKKQLQEQSLAERAKKAREIEEADEAVVQAQKDLEATEEWAALLESKEKRTAIGPLPKAVTVRAPRTGNTVRKSPTGVTAKMIRLLEHLKGGQVRGSRELAELTGIAKGKPFPEMEELGLIEVLIPDEGERGKRFRITAKGLEELEKAETEA